MPLPRSYSSDGSGQKTIPVKYGSTRRVWSSHISHGARQILKSSDAVLRRGASPTGCLAPVTPAELVRQSELLVVLPQLVNRTVFRAVPIPMPPVDLGTLTNSHNYFAAPSFFASSTSALLSLSSIIRTSLPSLRFNVTTPSVRETN